MPSMEKIEEEIKNCKRCDLWKTRNHCVVGSGNLNAKIMFIGEAPGYNEDLQGKPFVGKAGKFFDELLSSVELTRDEVYITNILKCRPPGNRNPTEEEIKACTPYLDRQIEIIKPKIICCLGNFATNYIFKKFNLKPESISKIHGKIFNISNLFGIKYIIPLYHPAVAVYNFNMKNILLEDFAKLKGLD